MQAFVEAEEYDGPSVIIAYAPCINHGYNLRYAQQHAFESVKSGYNTLFRYNPSKAEPMQVDSYEPTMNYREFVEKENRFSILSKVNKQNMDALLSASEQDAKHRREGYLNQQKLNKIAGAKQQAKISTQKLNANQNNANETVKSAPVKPAKQTTGKALKRPVKQKINKI